MANPTPPVRTCVLRVGIKCCKGCQTNAKRKLLSVAGVSAVEYNAEEGLLRVSGDPNPATLLRKLTKWGKKAELVSVLGDVSALAPTRTPEHNQMSMTMEKKKKKKKRPTKCILLRCFGKRIRKAKVEPYRGPWVENASTINAVTTPPMVYPPPRPIPGFETPIPYPPPYFRESQPPYSTAGMFRSAPPQSPSHFQLRQTQFPQMVNSRLHYPHH